MSSYFSRLAHRSGITQSSVVVGKQGPGLSRPHNTSKSSSETTAGIRSSVHLSETEGLNNFEQPQNSSGLAEDAVTTTTPVTSEVVVGKGTTDSNAPSYNHAANALDSSTTHGDKKHKRGAVSRPPDEALSVDMSTSKSQLKLPQTKPVSRHTDSNDDPAPDVGESLLRTKHSLFKQITKFATGERRKEDDNRPEEKIETSVTPRAVAIERPIPGLDSRATAIEPQVHRGPGSPSLQNRPNRQSRHGQGESRVEVHIGTISMDVHQAAPRPAPQTIPPPRRSRAATERQPPQASRLNRYYLKGW